MSTLITTGNTAGKNGRCDAKCYNAKGPKCDCCCGGVNHGVGLEQAIQNMNDMVQEILKEKKTERPMVIENLLF